MSTNNPMTADEALAVVDTAIEKLQDAGVIANTIRMKDARITFAALVARNAELEQSLVVALESGRGLSRLCTAYRERLETMTADRNALAADNLALRSDLESIRDYDPVGGDEWLTAVALLQKRAADALARTPAKGNDNG